MKLKLKLKGLQPNQQFVDLLQFIYDIYVGGYLEIEDEEIENQLLEIFNHNRPLLPYIGPHRPNPQEKAHANPN